MPPSKGVDDVSNEAMNYDEFVKFDNGRPLKERPTNNVKGESTSKKNLEEKFVPP
jgi:hypothetical protein